MEEFTNWDDPPPPPVLGKVTYSSVELIWNSQLLNGASTSSMKTLSLTSVKSYLDGGGGSKMKYIVQEEEIGGLVTKGYGTVYSGFAQQNTFSGLEARTMYRYRIKYKGDGQETPWSRPTEVMTTKKPPSADDLQKAINNKDMEKVQTLVEELDKELIDAPDKYGYTPLMNAVFKGFVNITKYLIKQNADVNAQNSSRKSALMVACFVGNLEVVKLLHQNGAKNNMTDNSGSTALHYAVDGGNTDVIRYLIGKGCKVDEKDFTSGWTPLMRLASTSGDISIARTLLQNRANVNAVDATHKSILMMASLNGHTSLVKLLVERGAIIDLTSTHNKTALDFARSFDHRQIILLLEEKMKEIRKEQSKMVNGPKRDITNLIKATKAN